MTISPSIPSRLFERFADLLSYPNAGLPSAVRDCRTLLRDHCPTAAEQLAGFEEYVSTASPAEIEEAYTHAFDLDALCHLYVGYHIFGESYKRSLFLLELRKRYRQCGLKIERELPDHLAAILRFLARSDDAIAEMEMIDEAILPSVERMLGKPSGAGQFADASEEAPPPEGESDAGLPPNHPYQAVLLTLRRILADQSATRQNADSRTARAGGSDHA